MSVYKARIIIEAVAFYPALRVMIDKALEATPVIGSFSVEISEVPNQSDGES